MSTVQEIEEAIRNLAPADRQKLIADLPTLFPEFDGDDAWERIIRDTRPRPALSALLDEAEVEFRRNPAGFGEISDKAFDHHT